MFLNWIPFAKTKSMITYKPILDIEEYAMVDCFGVGGKKPSSRPFSHCPSFKQLMTPSIAYFFYKIFITWLMNKNKYWNNAPTRVQFYIFNCLLFTRFCLYLPNQPAFGWLINQSLHLKVLNIPIRSFIMGVLNKKFNNWINTMCFFCKIKFDNVEYLV